MAELVRLTHHGDAAVITIDNPPVNALSPGVPEGIDSALKQAVADASVTAVVVIGQAQHLSRALTFASLAKLLRANGRSSRCCPICWRLKIHRSRW